MKILKALFLLLFILILFFSNSRLVNGQVGDLSWDITGLPGQREIDGNTPNVEIVFNGLEPDKTYYLNRKTDQDVKNTEILLDTIKSDSNGRIHLIACGDGKNKLKGERINGKTCREDKIRSDYFHEGQTYRLGLYEGNKGEAQIMVAEFYVLHTMPIVKLNTQKLGIFPGLKVTLSGRRPGTSDMNNYKLVLKGSRYDNSHCLVETKKSDTETIRLGAQKDFLLPIPPIKEADPTTVEFIRGSNSGLLPGRYKLEINERTDDTGITLRTTTCNDSFNYCNIEFDLAKDGNINEVISKCDPDGFDSFKLGELLNTADFPCSDFDKEKNQCKRVQSAVGPIDVTPEGFVETLFRFILTIAAFGAIIIIIYSGYIFITSRGDKEKIAGARETITSAIVGLLFIILSIVILEIIGVDILRIPGLTR